MVRPPRLDIALKRLYGALDALETGAHRLADAAVARRDVGDDGSVLGPEVERLRDERDAAMLRFDALERAATEVAGRLDGAGAALRRLLAPEGEE